MSPSRVWAVPHALGPSVCPDLPCRRPWLMPSPSCLFTGDKPNLCLATENHTVIQHTRVGNRQPPPGCEGAVQATEQSTHCGPCCRKATAASASVLHTHMHIHTGRLRGTLPSSGEGLGPTGTFSCLTGL